MNDKIAIKVSNVSKKYTIGKQKDSSLRGSLAGIFQSAETKVDEFWALKDVSFEINKGDVVGIIGKNGAGKSTLLKIFSQITKPTDGRIEINGRIASLLEVGTGFHPELTGRENIYLNGTILGMTRKEVKAKFDEIVAFSGVEKFIDTAVKHYSSGMYVRLAFAVAAHLEPEILIIDEVLAVGDAEFQKKCLGKMKDVACEGRTVIFVSHDLAAVQSLCTKGVLLEKGEIKYFGTTEEAINKYTLQNETKYFKKTSLSEKPTIIEVKIENLVSIIPTEDELLLKLQFVNINSSILIIGIAFRNMLGKKVSTIIHAIPEKKEQILISVASNTFNSGKYSLDIALFENKGVVYDYLQDVVSFEIRDNFSNLSDYRGDDIGSIKILSKHNFI